MRTLETEERGLDSLAEYVADVVDAAASLAERAVVSADRLAAQAVRDASRVADAFEGLARATIRTTLDLARDVVETVREAQDEASRRAD